MYRLSDPAIKAILKEWHPKTYCPPLTDAGEWIRSIESLCDLYGVPDVQRLECAAYFIKEEVIAELRSALESARKRFGPLHGWNEFKSFLIPFDQDFRERWEKLPFYKKHPKRTAVVLGIAGGMVLTPVAIAVSSYVGLTTAGFAAGSAAFSYQSFVYGSATRVLLGSFQSAGTTTVMPSIGTVLTGAATTGAGVLVATTAQPVTSSCSEILQQTAKSFADSEKPGGNSNGDPPPDSTTAPDRYLLTPRAILAIVKSWDVRTYNPPRTNCTAWLNDIHNHCEQYEIPTPQRASCAMHRMSEECKQPALDAGCFNMTWDEFTAWLRQQDHRGTNVNEKTMESFVEKSGM